jgi:hypothetical protein
MFAEGVPVEFILPALRLALYRSWLVAACVTVHLGVANPAMAQATADDPGTAPVAPLSEGEDDAVLSLSEPDFVVVNLPTTLRLPLFKSNVRVTHRFAGNLRNGSVGQQAGNLFGIDQGAIIGFEYRFAVARHTEAAFYRSGFDKTIQLYGKFDPIRQHRSIPVSVSPVVSVEGTDNFQEKHAPAGGVVVSRFIGTRVAAYVTPMWIHNSAASLDAIAHSHDGSVADAQGEDAHHNRNTTYVGLGGRTRVLGSTYIAAEIIPRATGYAPGRPAYGVSLEKRVGAHMFSLTFTNTFATTFAQLARGGAANTLYLGFNLGRKFF